jgi:hypothetical protein
MGIDFSYRYMVQFGFTNLEAATEFLKETARISGCEGCIIDGDSGNEVIRVGQDNVENH